MVMENINHSSPHLLLKISSLIFLITMLTTSTTEPTPPPNITNPPPVNIASGAMPKTAMQEVNNILDAFIGTGDTSINQWVSILTMSNPSLLSLTLFIPDQQSQQQQHSIMDPLLFPYHVIPQRLTFSDLLLFPVNARLPTLLPGKSIVVTDNSAANFSVDGTPLTHPDLYSTPSLSVHAVKALLDYSVFGEAHAPPPSPPFLPIGDAIGTAWKSDASTAVTASRSSNSVWFFVTFILLFV